MKKQEILKTFTECEESQYKVIQPLRVNKVFVLFMGAIFLAFIFLTAFENVSVPFTHCKLNAEDGAGTYWTCSNCGSSNKCYEMRCSNCGEY